MAAGSKVRGRFAPSPTGRQHLGNAWAAFMSWLAVRSQHGTMVLRIEDIDPQRSREEFSRLLATDLEWLGLDWDEGPDKAGPFSPYVQSQRLHLYDQALEALEARQAIYPCWCTRKEIQAAASDPARRNAGIGYPGLCRELSADERQQKMALGRNPTLRLLFSEDTYSFTDLFMGQITLPGTQLGGDFAVRRSDRVHAYQLAVTVDDGLMQINQVVRGVDILDSTPRQMVLYTLLGYSVPTFGHVPLLVDSTGKKLSKRHQSLELAALRERGISPRAIIGYLAHKAGFIDTLRPVSPAEFIHSFTFAPFPTQEIMVEDNVEEILASISNA